MEKQTWCQDVEKRRLLCYPRENIEGRRLCHGTGPGPETDTNPVASDDAGYGDFYEHGTGHGVGVEIHEAPWLSARSTDVLQENMVLTVEPGIYLPRKYGVRIEDMVVVTKDGIENFYTAAKDLIIIL